MEASVEESEDPPGSSELETPLAPRQGSWRSTVRRGRSTGEQQTRLEMRDHFSLRSALFRHQDKIVMDSFRHQFIFALEEEPGGNMHNPNTDRSIVVSVERAARWGTKVAFAQFMYLYIVIFLFGAATIFCLLLFLQFALGIFLTGISKTNPSPERIATVFTLFALPVFLDFMAMLMTLLLGFLSDISNDFEFYDTIEILSNRQRDWVRVTCAVFIPIAALALSFFFGAPSPVQNFLMTAMAGNLFLFAIYLFYTFALEAISCMKIVRVIEGTSALYDTIVRLATLQYSARFALIHKSQAQVKPLGKWQRLLYRPVTPVRRTWEIENVLRPRPVYTQKRGIFFLCYMHLSKIRGAIPKMDFVGSLLCIGAVSFLVWLLIAGILVFYEFVPPGIDALLSAILAVVFLAYLVTHYKNYIEYVKEDRKFSSQTTWTDWQEEHFLGRRPSNINAASWRKLCQARKTKFVYAEPKAGFMLSIAVAQVVLGVLIPVGSFYALGVTGFGTVYLIAALFSLRSALFNVNKLIMIYGTDALTALDFPWPSEDISGSTLPPSQTVKNGRRLYFLLTRMKKREIKTFWFLLLSIGISIAIFLIAISVDRDTSEKHYKGPAFIGSAANLTHAYAPSSDGLSSAQNSVCSVLTHIPRSSHLSITDFAFLSDLAYAQPTVAQEALDSWFGNASGRYRHIPKKDYAFYSRQLSSKVVMTLVEHSAVPRQEDTTDALESAGEFRAPDMGDGKTFIVALRGTIKVIDLLADMQLWFPAIMFQVLRYVLPFGSIWNDVISALIRSFDLLESAPYQHISYLRDIVAFIKALRQKHPNANVLLTGHSLGGGIAILAGAKEGAPAVAISGVNAMLSRRKFRLSAHDLDKYSLNVMPRGDIVTWVDDPALLVETISCRSSPKSGKYILFKCHQVQRTVCELQYTCGSGRRPPYRECSEKYSYPFPSKVDKELLPNAYKGLLGRKRP